MPYTFTLPPGLEEFPWSEYLYMWDYDAPYRAVRIKLWFPYMESQTAQGYWLESSTGHLAVWEWLEARYAMRTAPTLELTGDGSWEATEPQEWSRLAIYGTYLLGPKRKTWPVSTT